MGAYVHERCVGSQLRRQSTRRVFFVVVEGHVLVQHRVQCHLPQASPHTLAKNAESAEHEQRRQAW